MPSGYSDYRNTPRKKKKKKIDKKAPIGSVKTHDMKIPPTILKSKAPIPRASPIPITAPTSIWVVETGIPVREAITTVAPLQQVLQKNRV